MDTFQKIVVYVYVISVGSMENKLSQKQLINAMFYNLDFQIQQIQTIFQMSTPLVPKEILQSKA
jgi:hypothetical protein